MMITVIVTSHNISRLLPACLHSIAEQSLAPNHVLIIDDHSSDDSADVIRQFISSAEARGSKTQWHLIVKEKNEGQAAAINQGLIVCRQLEGMNRDSFIALMDGDDIMMPERLARQASILQQNPQIQFAMGSIQPFTEKEDRSWQIHAPITRELKNSQETKAWAMFQTTAYTCMLMFRAWMTEEQDFLFRQSNGNDWEMITRHSNRPLIWDAPVTQWYRRHAQQMTHHMSDNLSTAATYIRKRELAKIGLTPSDSEMWLHITIGSCDFWRIEEIQYFWDNKNHIIYDAEIWLQKIKTANALTQYIEEEAMKYACDKILATLKENVERHSLASPPPQYRF